MGFKGQCPSLKFGNPGLPIDKRSTHCLQLLSHQHSRDDQRQQGCKAGNVYCTAPSRKWPPPPHRKAYVREFCLFLPAVLVTLNYNHSKLSSLIINSLRSYYGTWIWFPFSGERKSEGYRLFFLLRVLVVVLWFFFLNNKAILNSLSCSLSIPFIAVSVWNS